MKLTGGGANHASFICGCSPFCPKATSFSNWQRLRTADFAEALGTSAPVYGSDIINSELVAKLKKKKKKQGTGRQLSQ